MPHQYYHICVTLGVCAGLRSIGNIFGYSIKIQTEMRGGPREGGIDAEVRHPDAEREPAERVWSYRGDLVVGWCSN